MNSPYQDDPRNWLDKIGSSAFLALSLAAYANGYLFPSPDCADVERPCLWTYERMMEKTAEVWSANHPQLHR